MGNINDAPKPKPPARKPTQKEEKKPFIRKPHLTQRPFDALKSLQNQTAVQKETEK